MKILLLGEYSNVHHTLSKGLKELGHAVTVASDGDHWKNFPRDIDLARKTGTLGTISYLAKLCRALPRLKGYDIIQLINPIFLDYHRYRHRCSVLPRRILYCIVNRYVIWQSFG